MEVKRIAVVGNGLMGKGIAHVFASYGYTVDLFGRRDDIYADMHKYLDAEVKKELVSPQQRDNILCNIGFYNINCSSEKLSECDLIIETVKEDIEIKKGIFEMIDKHAKASAIIASNTSNYSITKLAGFVSHPRNFVGMHFFSPVPKMKLVEVVRGEKTHQGVINVVHELVNGIEKLPIRVKDSPGFVLNRGLFVMINEAVYMLNDEIEGGVEDIDNAFISGTGMKVGPLKLADMVGIDVTYTIIQNMYEGFKDSKYMPCPLLKRMVDDGRLGKKAGEGFYSWKSIK